LVFQLQSESSHLFKFGGQVAHYECDRLNSPI
jgi:hypothetical protein